MGNKTTSQPSPGGFGNQSGGQGTFSDGQTNFFPEEGYVDKVHMYTGGNGATRNFVFGVYRTDTSARIAQTGTNAFGGKAWKIASLTSKLHLTSGYGWCCGSWCDGSQDIGINAGVGYFYFVSGSSIAGNRVNGAPNPFGNSGQLFYYLEYFQPLTVTSVSQTPVGIGQTFTVGGRSFTANISAVTIHGAAGDVNVTSYTVDSDTQITCTVPPGATTGTVEVDSDVGNATSTQTVQISGGYYKTGGVLYPIKGMYYKTGGVLYPVKALYYKTGGVLNPIK